MGFQSCVTFLTTNAQPYHPFKYAIVKNDNVASMSKRIAMTVVYRLFDEQDCIPARHVL